MNMDEFWTYRVCIEPCFTGDPEMYYQTIALLIAFEMPMSLLQCFIYISLKYKYPKKIPSMISKRHINIVTMKQLFYFQIISKIYNIVTLLLYVNHENLGISCEFAKFSFILTLFAQIIVFGFILPLINLFYLAKQMPEFYHKVNEVEIENFYVRPPVIIPRRDFTQVNSVITFPKKSLTMFKASVSTLPDVEC